MTTTTPTAIEHLSPEEKRALLAQLLSRKRGELVAVPLSYAQERLWFLDQFQPGGAVYNIPTAMRIEVPINVAAMERALKEIVHRHEILRTRFTTEQGKPVQVVEAEDGGFHVEVRDISALPPEEREREAGRLAAAEAGRAFDLTRAPLLRAVLLRLAEADHVLLLTMHHIVSDGWSMSIFFREYAALYEAYCQGRPSVLPALPMQYKDYARWQREWLTGRVLEEQLAYWKAQLAGMPPVLELPTDRARPVVQSFAGAYRGFALSPALSGGLKSLADRQGVTMFMLLLAAWQTLLHRYTGQSDMVVGTPIAGRNREETEGLIGFFVNTLVLRADLSGDPDFLGLLAQVKELSLEAFAHQDLPFEKLVEELHPERSLGRNPLVQVTFAFQSTPVPTQSGAPSQSRSQGGSASPEVATGTAKFDLTLTAAEGAEGLTVALEYATDLFDAETVERMGGHLQALLQGIVAAPEQRLSQLPLLTEAERHQLLVQWNDTDADYRKEACIHRLIEAQAAQRPDAPAVLFQGERVSYGELNRRANRLGHYLQAQGVGPERRVGVSMERCPETIVALLGVLKAGGAYVPLDPSYPTERLAFMMEDARLPLLLTQQALLENLPVGVERVVCLDADWPSIEAAGGDENPDSEVGPDNLAYVIYTSGSTGRPKGVTIAHRAVCNMSSAYSAAIGLGADDRFLQFAPLSFDASAAEVFMSLTTGAILCMGTRDALIPGPGLHELLRDEAVTHAILPPSVLAVLPNEGLPAFGTIVSAGEACTPDIVARWAEGRRVFNGYGPTEATVCATVARCGADGRTPPIGKPLANTRTYILDAHLTPVPVGVFGELYIGGAGLARGYLDRPALTAERFVDDPFSMEPGARLYKTGDRARYRVDGNIEFLGRLDDQIKLRGFRIELGEIEATLSAYPAVRESAVVVREDIPGDKRLVAYVVTDGEETLMAELRDHVRRKLPDYMVPSAFVSMAALPLAPSGKVDRTRLPVPDAERPDLAETYVAPRDEVEEAVAAIWREVLGFERIGVNDNFFELGGHSLLATQVVSRIRKACDVELPLRRLFEEPTVAALATGVTALKGEGEPVVSVPGGADDTAAGKMPAMLGGDNPGFGVAGVLK